MSDEKWEILGDKMRGAALNQLPSCVNDMIDLAKCEGARDERDHIVKWCLLEADKAHLRPSGQKSEEIFLHILLSTT